MPGARLAARVRRLAAGALAAGLLLAWPLAGVASADNLVVVIRSPADGVVQTGTNTVRVAGDVGTNLARVNGVHVQILWAPTGAVVDQGAGCNPCGQGSSVPFEASFALRHNGPYIARVVASGDLLGTGIPVPSASADRPFSVAVPPAAPTGLKAEHLPNDHVRLTWNPVPNYPDLVGYVVYRGPVGGELRAVPPGVEGTTVTDTRATDVGGRVQYQVAALRNGAVPGPSDWLESRSNVVTVELSAAPTTPPTTTNPGETTTTTVAGGALPTGADSDLAGFFGSAGTSTGNSNVSLPPLTPSPSPSIELPDAGFSQSLPFPTDFGPKVEGRQPGRPSSASGTADVETGTGELSDSNRRALLVPVAAGSVLCVAALHLRWLNRRLVAAGAAGALGSGPLEPADLDLDLHPDDLPADREPVAAGTGARTLN